MKRSESEWLKRNSFYRPVSYAKRSNKLNESLEFHNPNLTAEPSLLARLSSILPPKRPTMYSRPTLSQNTSKSKSNDSKRNMSITQIPMKQGRIQKPRPTQFVQPSVIKQIPVIPKPTIGRATLSTTHASNRTYTQRNQSDWMKKLIDSKKEQIVNESYETSTFNENDFKMFLENYHSTDFTESVPGMERAPKIRRSQSETDIIKYWNNDSQLPGPNVTLPVSQAMPTPILRVKSCTQPKDCSRVQNASRGTFGVLKPKVAKKVNFDFAKEHVSHKNQSSAYMPAQFEGLSVIVDEECEYVQHSSPEDDTFTESTVNPDNETVLKEVMSPILPVNNTYVETDQRSHVKAPPLSSVEEPFTRTLTNNVSKEDYERYMLKEESLYKKLFELKKEAADVQKQIHEINQKESNVYKEMYELKLNFNALQRETLNRKVEPAIIKSNRAKPCSSKKNVTTEDVLNDLSFEINELVVSVHRSAKKEKNRPTIDRDIENIKPKGIVTRNRSKQLEDEHQSDEDTYDHNKSIALYKSLQQNYNLNTPVKNIALLSVTPGKTPDNASAKKKKMSKRVQLKILNAIQNVKNC